MFRVQNPDNPQAGCYVINADYTHNIFKLFEFPTGGSIAEVPLSDVEPNADGSYDIKVIVVGEDIYVYANGKRIMRVKDSRHKEILSRTADMGWKYRISESESQGRK